MQANMRHVHAYRVYSISENHAIPCAPDVSLCTTHKFQSREGYQTPSCAGVAECNVSKNRTLSADTLYAHTTAGI